MHRYKELKVWQKGRELVSAVYQATSTFPKNEDFGLTSQIRKSAVSIPANIAEGCGRNTNPELNRFLDIAVGSAFELETLIILSVDLDLIKKESSLFLITEIDEIQRMLFGFKKQLSGS